MLKVHWLNLYAKFSITERTDDFGCAYASLLHYIDERVYRNDVLSGHRTPFTSGMEVCLCLCVFVWYCGAHLVNLYI